MKTLHNQIDKQATIDRLIKLKPDTQAMWGKMTVDQMVCHISDQVRVATGEIPSKPIGNFFTHTLLKWLIIYILPVPKGKVQTVKEMQSTVPEDFQQDLNRAIELITKFAEQGNDYRWAEHPYFGKLSRNEWGKLSYSHIDHHLKQFGV